MAGPFQYRKYRRDMTHLPRLSHVQTEAAMRQAELIKAAQPKAVAWVVGRAGDKGMGYVDECLWGGGECQREGVQGRERCVLLR